MAIELATAYVSILPETSRLKAEMNKALGEIDKSSSKTGKSMGGRIASGLASTAKAGLVTAGVGIGAAFSTSLAKGFGRLSAIQGAESTLKGLGHEQESVSKIMASANESVTGTAYGLGDAASLAAQMVASGIKPGQDLTKVLKTIADTSTVAGTDFNHMGNIFAKVAATTKLQGDEMNSIMGAGLPILDILGESLGKSATEVRKMVSDGEINFEIFAKALEEKVGGASQGANETVSGAMSNMGAAMGRFGAEILTGPFNAAPGVIGGVIDQINNLTNRTKAMFDYFSTGVTDFSEGGLWQKAFGTKENAQPVIDFMDDVRLKWEQFEAGFKTGQGTGAFGSLGKSIREVADAFKDAWPHIWKIVKSLAEAGLGAAVVSLVVAFGTLAPLLTDILVPVLEALGTLMEDNQEFVNNLVLALVGFVGLNSAAGALNNFIKPAGKLVGVFKNLKKLAPSKIFGNFISLGGSLKTIGTILGGVLWKGLTLVAGGIKAVGLAIVANPIGALIAVIAAVVAGLIYFFTQTETGKKAWQTFVDKLKEIWTWIKDNFTKLWDSVTDKWNKAFNWVKERIDKFKEWFEGAKETVGNVLEAIGNGWKKLVEVFKLWFTVLMTIIITPFYLAWKFLSWQISSYWENVIKPVLQAFGDFFQMVWNDYIKPTIDWIVFGWNVLTTAISGYWNNTIKPTFQAFGDKIVELWNAYVSPVLDWISNKWSWLGTVLTAVWLAIKAKVFDAWNTTVDWVSTKWDTFTTVVKFAWDWLSFEMSRIWHNIKSAVFDAWNRTVDWFSDKWGKVTDFVNEKWSWMRDRLSEVWEWINTKVFDPMGRGLDTLRDWFGSAVESIAKLWDGLKEKVGTPIKWVVDNVYNDGIRVVWEHVSDFVGLDKKLPKVDLAYARGGVLPGYTPGRDPHTFVNPKTGMRIGLSGGEAIMRPEWTRAMGGPRAVDRMNSAARKGRLRDVMHPDDKRVHERFASGGIIPAMMAVVQKKYPQLTMTSGYRPGDGGMHGRGQATDWSNGSGNTPAQLALAHDIATTYPGSAQLIYDSPGWSGNIANGANVGAFGGYYNMAEAGPHHHHVHWGMTVPPTMHFGGGVFEGGSDGSGGGFANWARTKVAGVVDRILTPIGDAIPTFGGMIGEYPKAAFDFMKDQFVGAIMPAADASGYNGPVPDSVEHWRPLVEKLLAVKGQPLSLANSTLRRMDQESSGNPGAINLWDSNAVKGTPSKGLMQVIDPTFAANKDPGYDDIWDPESNIRASMNYALRQYGSLGAAYDRAGGYDSGGWLPPTPGGFASYYNHTGQPEAVLTASQWGLFSRLINFLPNTIKTLDNAAEEISLAYQGRDWGYGALLELLGRSDWAKGIVDTAHLVGVAVEEIQHAYQQRDSGFGALLDIVGNKHVAKAIVDTAAHAGLVRIALEEIQHAYQGRDSGYGALLEVLGREDWAKGIVDTAHLVGVAVEEIQHAYQDRDSGYGALAEILGREDWAKAIVDTSHMIGQGVRGFEAWARATTEQDRMGTPEEWGIHFGQMAAHSFADDALGLLGLGGIVGSPIRGSLVDLVNAGADTFNKLNPDLPFRAGHIATNSLQPVSLLDDTGRRVGTKLQATSEAASTTEVAAREVEPKTKADVPTMTIKVDGQKTFTAEDIEKMLAVIDDNIDEVKIDVERLKEDNVTSVTNSITTMA